MLYSRSFTPLALAAAIGGLLLAPPAQAGCGCDKPAPPRAALRPFVASASQTVTLFDDALETGATYDVAFESRAGDVQWVRGTATREPDIADGQPRNHLRVTLPDLSLGPCAVAVWRDGARRFQVAADDFTVAARPIALHDVTETVDREYRAAVGADGTVYIPVDVSAVSDATRFSGTALGMPLQYQASNVAMYNDQGYLMQLLDAEVAQALRPEGRRLRPAARRCRTGGTSSPPTRRHEAGTAHARHDAAGEWHADGTRHVDHDHIVVALRGAFADGSSPAPGATPPFRLVIASQPEAL